MIEGVVIKQLSKNKDERGWLVEIFRNDEVNLAPEMSYISVTKSGVIRGPHEHRFQSDFFVLVGPGNFILHLWDRRKGSSTEGVHMEVNGGSDNQIAVLVPPGIVHGYKCISTIEGWCINLPDKLYKGKNKAEEVDEIRWENQVNSPYKIT